ncbi:MAG: MotA/TolQ/ExbB proton channel family protein [Planctomycetes bacterium]|nr:MotA/TolQ/ExbB proton channel family protein [Planctomycetota bacterium]
MDRAVIQFLAANINWIILAFFVVGIGGLAVLSRQASRIPDHLRYVLGVILDEIRDPGLGRQKSQDNLTVLYALKQHLAASDPVRRGHLQGRILESNRWKPDIAGEGTRRFGHVLGVFGEIFPLLGILGTVCAMAAKGMLPADANPEQVSATFAEVVRLFGTAVTSTVYGIVCAVIFIPLFQWISAKLESGYKQAEEYRAWIGQMEMEVVRFNSTTVG